MTLADVSPTTVPPTRLPLGTVTRRGFLAGSANIGELDPACASYPILRESRNAELNTVLSNSFGFGGVNAVVAFRAMP